MDMGARTIFSHTEKCTAVDHRVVSMTRHSYIIIVIIMDHFVVFFYHHSFYSRAT